MIPVQNAGTQLHSQGLQVILAQETALEQLPANKLSQVARNNYLLSMDSSSSKLIEQLEHDMNQQHPD